MDTVPPPPPPPPPPTPPSSGIHPKKHSSPPRPLHAALPFNRSPPIQETRPSPNCGAQGAVAPSPHHTVQNGHQPSLSHGEEEHFSDCDDKSHPVQETAPAPQALNASQASTAEVGVEMSTDQT